MVLPPPPINLLSFLLISILNQGLKNQLVFFLSFLVSSVFVLKTFSYEKVPEQEAGQLPTLGSVFMP